MMLAHLLGHRPPALPAIRGTVHLVEIEADREPLPPAAPDELSQARTAAELAALLGISRQAAQQRLKAQASGASGAFEGCPRPQLDRACPFVPTGAHRSPSCARARGCP